MIALSILLALAGALSAQAESSADAEAGEQLYQQLCLECHGKYGPWMLAVGRRGGCSGAKEREHAVRHVRERVDCLGHKDGRARREAD